MRLEIYVNRVLIDTLEIPGPGYNPQEIIDVVKQTHEIKFGDQLRLVPRPDAD